MSAKILVLDIERVSAVVDGIWGLGDRKYIDPSQIVTPSRTISVAWKWLEEPKIHFAAEWQDGGHETMIGKAWEAMNECTHLVGWNSAGFDVKHLRSHFFEYGMDPTSPHVDVDLLKVVRKNFNFMSNRMAYIADVLGLEGKAESYGLWRDLRSEKRGVVKRAQQQFSLYNKRDVELTEELYYLLRPWVANLNLTRYEDNLGMGPYCSNCLSDNIQHRGYSRKTNRRYRRFQCNDCGKYGQYNKSIDSTETVGI